MTIDFTSSKDSDEICTMHTKSNNIEIMMGNETDQIIEELFEYLLQKIVNLILIELIYCITIFIK